MALLDELQQQLAEALLDPFGLSLPSEAINEALRRALEELNLLFEVPLQLAGLDGSLSDNLPGFARPALMSLAEAQALGSGLGGRLIGFDGSLAGGPALLAHCEARMDAAEKAYEKLRVYLLQTSRENPCFALPWQDGAS